MNHSMEPVTFTRNVIGILIPQGTKVELPEGAHGAITQALGGSYTVQVEGHLFRLDGKDADAIGKEAVKLAELPADASDEDIEKAVWEQLKTCFDPEIPINIVELGLVYECRVEKIESGGRKAVVRMTLTAPGCGMGDILVGDIKSKLAQLPALSESDVQLVFDPPWNQTMMSEAARLQTGMF